MPTPPVADAVRLLLIDDERSIREPLGDYLTGQGFALTSAADAREARRLLEGGQFDLVISDIMMPGEDGLSLTRFIRETLGLPVILLTARAEETERVIGLEIGADDYVVKPFSPRELVARIRAVLRRAGGSGPNGATAETADESCTFDGWRFDAAARSLTHADGRVAALTAGEYQLLIAFLRHPNRVLSRDRLLDLVRGRDADIFDRSIDNLVSRLRKKLEDDPREPRWIKTVWGGGYMFAASVTPLTGQGAP